MRPEAAFVTGLAAGDRERVDAAWRAAPDWEAVAELAACHQVDALCWWMWRHVVAAGKTPERDLPAPLHGRLRAGYLQHKLRNEALLDDLAVLEEALEAGGVRRLYLKGPWVALEAYPDPGTRPVDDIDLCVPETQVGPAVAALRSAGWQPTGPAPRSPAEALEHSHYRRQLRFSGRGRRPVELHFRLVNMGPPAAAEPWVLDRTRIIAAGPCALRVPAPEAMLLHLLLHANQHGFAVLRLLHDVRWAIARDHLRLDAGLLLRQARALRCRAACYHACRLAAELAGATPPEALLRKLRPPLPRRLLFALTWRLAAVRRLEAPKRRMEAESPLFYLLEMGRWRDKARFAARVISEAGGPRTLLDQWRGLHSSDPPRSRSREPIALPRYPARRRDLILRQDGEELAVYDPGTDQTALLNRCAAVVLDLCDGTRTAADISAEIAAALSGESRELTADVEAALEDLATQGLLQPRRDLKVEERTARTA